MGYACTETRNTFTSVRWLLRIKWLEQLSYYLAIYPPYTSLSLTSTTHTYTYNPAPDTWHAAQTNPAHGVHENHACNSYKTPSTAPQHAPASASRPPLLSPDQDSPTTACTAHTAASACCSSDTPVPATSPGISRLLLLHSRAAAGDVAARCDDADAGAGAARPPPPW